MFAVLAPSRSSIPIRHGFQKASQEANTVNVCQMIRWNGPTTGRRPLDGAHAASNLVVVGTKLWLSPSIGTWCTSSTHERLRLKKLSRFHPTCLLPLPRHEWIYIHVEAPWKIHICKQRRTLTTHLVRLRPRHRRALTVFPSPHHRILVHLHPRSLRELAGQMYAQRRYPESDKRCRMASVYRCLRIAPSPSLRHHSPLILRAQHFAAFDKRFAREKNIIWTTWSSYLV